MLKQFNMFCVTWILLGVIGLVFLIDPNIYNFGLDKNDRKSCLHWVHSKSKILGFVLRLLLTMMAVMLVLSPAIGGIVYLMTTTETREIGILILFNI